MSVLDKELKKVIKLSKLNYRVFFFRQAVEEIPQEMTRRVMENFRNRLQQCNVVMSDKALADSSAVRIRTLPSLCSSLVKKKVMSD